MAYANIPKREVEKVRKLCYTKLLKTDIHIWFFPLDQS